MAGGGSNILSMHGFDHAAIQRRNVPPPKRLLSRRNTAARFTALHVALSQSSIGNETARYPGRYFNGYYQAFYRQICYLTAMRISISMLSPGELQAAIAQRAKQRRLDLELTQAGLAERSGVSLGTLKQFERTGKASLDAVIRLAFALEAEEEFAALFPSRPPQTIDDIVSPRTRQRGRRR